MANDDSFCECEKCEDERTIAAYEAEIAKLRAERDEWKDKAHSLNEDRAAARDAVFNEGLARIEAEKQLAAARAALANLDWSDATGHTFMDLRRALEKAGTNPWRTDHGGADRVQVAIDCVRQLCTEIQSSRAALDGEREACDRWRRHWDRFGYSATLAPNACVMDSIIAHDQRRAAEAKASRGGEGGA